MALRLRKDVQKASYYVWFLGAQEAKGLRGSRVLLPVIPRLIEKSKEHEPLKVTLQVSHKGLKIIQGSAKHFIPHGAITCSVQTEDIVACILLLYNPATKCPLHVHAYRCDSEMTAQALNEQLQILINRPENQKRFAELETRLGLPAQLTASVVSAGPERKQQHHQSQMSRRFDSPRRFDSSHGSDTGTSTRESECSEEQQHSPTSPISPISSQSKLYDSLAAELREKLSGGVPLLLPTRECDKANNNDPRRCRNPCIVSSLPSVGNKHGVSSRGSSGIGSDLAPSPERQDTHSSSEEEWVNDQEPQFGIPSHQSQNRSKERYVEEHVPRVNKYREPPTTYLYPNVRQEAQGRFQRSSSREEDQSLRGSVNSREEEVKPIITKPTPLQNRFREAFGNEDFMLEDRKKKITIDDTRHDAEDDRRRNRHHEADRGENYMYKKSNGPGKYYDGYENDKVRYRENLTDRQKYHEIISESSKYQDESPKHRGMRDGYREYSPERVHRNKYSTSYDDHRDFKIERDYRDPVKPPSKREPPYIRDESPDDRYRADFNERRAYKESEPMVYRDSSDKNGKAPLTRFKSSEEPKHSRDRYDDRWERQPMYPEDRSSEDKYRDVSSRYRDDIRKSPVMKKIEARAKMVEIKTSSPESTIRKVSPKDRFQNAKEKFQQMERERHEEERIERERQEREQIIHNKRASEAPRRSSIEPVVVSSHESNGWSSEEDEEEEDIRSRGPPRSANSAGYRETETTERYPGLDREPRMPSSRMMPAKSLGNLTKGYRHSYAEPRPPPVPRSSGRVGLAAVKPY
ncbi:zinc finger CCCH domain-containing protein 13 [Ochlerotatus camptorhynchus]|uniref:zinc finger CCCH domain-containing protein 13 n=1 Tax=Ochlerotatus camptorhynchus TaxID=644619 RepID=UPI0031DBAA2C